MVIINKIWRKHGKPEPDNQTAWEFIYESVELKDLGISLEMLQRIRVSMASDPLTRAPFTYQLSNNSGNTKRMKDRLKTLEQQSEKTTQSHNIGDVEIVENVEANRVQILFPDIPSEEIRTELKRHGFRWSRHNQAWQRHLNDHAVYLAKEIVDN